MSIEGKEANGFQVNMNVPGVHVGIGGFQPETNVVGFFPNVRPPRPRREYAAVIGDRPVILSDCRRSEATAGAFLANVRSA